MKKELFNQIIEYATNNEFNINYANFISWATWNEKDLNDISMFSDPEVINLLKTDHIILGLNAADVDSCPEENAAVCGGFHCKHQGGRDSWLRDATKNTSFEYAYMSDSLKVKETESNKVLQYLKRNPEIEELQLRLLVNELSLLGKDLRIIVIGEDAELILHKAIALFDGKIRYETIPHYAKRGIKKKEFLEFFSTAIKNIE